MKSSILKSFTIVTVFLGGLLISNPAKGGVASVINSPASSLSTIAFVDTNSYDTSSNPGSFYSQNVSPWGGLAPINNALPLTTDPIGDKAKGTITADVIAGNYSLALNNVQLNQAALNTGFADLIFSFSVEFQLDGAGLASQATIFPNFAVNGTVQSSAGSFASVKGYIDYYGVNTAGTYSLLDTVNYNNLFSIPGPFTGTVTGVPVGGTTPTLAPNTTLTLVGVIDFRVDPANINVETIPEPTTISLVLVGLLGVVGLRRHTV